MIVHPVPRSVARDVGWGGLFLVLAVWWCVIGARHLMHTTPRPAVDFHGNHCGHHSRGTTQFLYYPQPGKLQSPVCVLRCPTFGDVENQLTIDELSPGTSHVYGEAIGRTPVYPSEQFSSFLCLPHDRTLGNSMAHDLGLSQSKMRAWIFASSISSGGPYWLLVAMACLALLLAPCLNWAVLHDPRYLHLGSFLVVPSLTVVLIVCSNKVNMFQDYSRLIMASGVTMSSALSLFVCIVSLLCGVMLYKMQSRSSIGLTVFKVYKSATNSIPGLWVLPSCMAVLMVAVVLLSLRISSAVLISTPNAIKHSDTVFRPAFIQPRAVPSPPRILANDNLVTLLGDEIKNLVPEGKVKGPDPYNNHLRARNPLMVGEHAGPFDQQDLVEIKAPIQKVTMPLPKVVTTVAPPPPMSRNMPPSGVLLRTSWVNVISLFVYLFCCLMLVEAIVAVNNTFVAAWTTVWYYSPPDIGGDRTIEMPAIKYASLTTLSTHLTNVIAISAINALMRPIMLIAELVLYIPQVYAWWNQTLRAETKYASPLYHLGMCASTTTVAHSLIHGYTLYQSTKTLVSDDMMNQCVRRVLRTLPMALFALLPVCVATVCGIVTLMVCTITPAFIRPSDQFYVSAPMLTAVVAFVISYYITLMFSSSVLQSVDCLVCCYQFERNNASATAYTPDEFSMIHSEVRAAAHEFASKVDSANNNFDLETPEFMKTKPSPQLGYEADVNSESSVLYKSLDTKQTEADAVSAFLQGEGGMTFA